MASEGYELLALFMRYVFVALGALIVWHAFRWMRKDAKAYKRQMKRLPDAGLVGEIVNLNTGERLPLPREGVMGAARSCDVRVKGSGVARKHVLFSFEEGKGLCMTPFGRRRFVMEETEMAGPAYALHGTVVCLGDVPLRVRLFAGIDAPHPMAYEPDEAAFEEEFPEAWEDDAGVPYADHPFSDELDPFGGGTGGVYPPAGAMPYQFPEDAEEDDGEQMPMYQSPLTKRHRRRRRP